MVATFEWAEILSYADADDLADEHASMLNEARLRSHSTLQRNAFYRFCSEKKIKPKEFSPIGEDLRQFQKYYNPEKEEKLVTSG